MIQRMRLLPILILTLVLVCFLRLGDVWQDLVLIGPREAVAQVAEKKKVAERKKAPETGDPKKADEETKSDAGKAEAGKAEAAKPEAEAADTPERIDPATLSPSEVAVLQALGQRRQKLDMHRRELETRAGVLKATEAQIDEKIARLKKIEASIQAMIEKQDALREEQLKSLVKVYESMKPKDAARILDRLDIEILLEVTGRMRESKMAAIMAKMTPTRAEELTVRLARQPYLPETEG